MVILIEFWGKNPGESTPPIIGVVKIAVWCGKSHAMTSSEIFQKRLQKYCRMDDQKLGLGAGRHATRIVLSGVLGPIVKVFFQKMSR